MVVKMVNGNLFTHVAPWSSEELVYTCTCVSYRIGIWKWILEMRK